MEFYKTSLKSKNIQNDQCRMMLYDATENILSHNRFYQVLNPKNVHIEVQNG